MILNDIFEHLNLMKAHFLSLLQKKSIKFTLENTLYGR